MRATTQQRLPLAAVLLTALIAFQSVGWLLAWQGLQFGAKVAAQKALLLEGSTLRESTFHKAFIQKASVGRKEINLLGQLFDYQVLSETGDSIRVALYHDHYEQVLLSALGQVFKSEKDDKSASSPVALWLAKWLGSAFLLPEKPLVASSVAPLFHRQQFITLLFMAQSAPGVFAPPPEV